MSEKPLALGIIGHPIGHTLSPALHYLAAAHNAIAITYSAYDVSPENLKKALGGVRALSIDGLNVTVPHKVAVMEFLDEFTPEAKKIGAVNTISRAGEKLVGHNTDLYGFVTSIRENAGFQIIEKRVFVYGAGGAARAVIFGLIAEGATEIVICNRTELNAINLSVEILLEEPSANLKPIGFDANNLVELVECADIIVNTTSLGMGGADDMPPGLEKIHKEQLVVDIVYRPLLTPLLRRADEAGARTLDGLWMLIHQGAEAFRLWTGRAFPLEKARKTMLSEL